MTGSVGVFTTDRDLVVTSWDGWLEAVTGIAAADARGRRIDVLYPELEARGITARMRRVIRQGIFEVLAPAFHKYVLPCPPRVASAHFEHMRQFVTISPLRENDEITGVSVAIEDVTPRLEHERRLLLQLRAPDESARLEAASTLAGRHADASLLSESLGDSSWRVRRVTSEGIAAAGGTHATGALIEALREHHSDPSVLSATLGAIAGSREDLVADLTTLCATDDADLRTYAALALGLVRDTRAVPALVSLLGDTDTNVRYHAIEALGRIGDRSAAEPLARMAEARDFFLAFAALDALAAIGEPSVASRLLPLLDEPALLGAAASCLGAIGTEDIVVPLASLFAKPDTPVLEVARGLAALYRRLQDSSGEGAIVADLARSAVGREGVRALFGALDAARDETEMHAVVTVLGWLRHDGIDAKLAALLSNTAIRQHVAEVLGGRGATAVPALVTAASELDAEGKKLVAMALARTGSTDAVPHLIGQLDGDPPVVIAAAAALGAIGDRRAFDPLVGVLDHPHDAVRRAAIGSLNSIGHPGMEDAVVRLLGDVSPRVRESAVRIAGYFGYPSCLEAMVRLASDKDEHVRRAVVEHLPNFDDARSEMLVRDALARDASATVRAAAARGVAQIPGASSLRALLAACGDPDMWVRYYAARGLAHTGDTSASVAEMLGRLALHDTAPPIRIAAIEALASFRQTGAVSLLEQLTRDPEQEVAEAALRGLGAFSRSSTRHVLAREVRSEDQVRRGAALAAIAHQRNEEWIPQLRELAESGDLATRTASIAALRDIGSGSAIATLVQLAESMQLRPAVLAALGTLDARQVAFLGDALAYEKEGIRCMVVEALGRSKHPAGTSLLVGALDDPAPSVRLAATQALSRVDVRGATGRLAYQAREMATPRDAPAVD